MITSIRQCKVVIFGLLILSSYLIACSSAINPTQPAPDTGAGNDQRVAKLVPARYDVKVYSNVIECAMPAAGACRVEVLGPMGDMVWAFDFVATEAGWYAIQWNGRNESGKEVGQGIYVVCMSVATWSRCALQYWSDGSFSNLPSE